jgi:hypothetical protein
VLFVVLMAQNRSDIVPHGAPISLKTKIPRRGIFVTELIAELIQ